MGGPIPPGSGRYGMGNTSPVTLSEKETEAYLLEHNGKATLDHPPKEYVPKKEENLKSRLLRRIKSFGGAEFKG